jgi:menaquinone-9 beta-reductase
MKCSDHTPSKNDERVQPGDRFDQQGGRGALRRDDNEPGWRRTRLPSMLLPDPRAMPYDFRVSASPGKDQINQMSGNHDQSQPAGVPTPATEVDVTVIGGGLAGMAASIHLAKAGMRVLCVEAEVANTDPVGESLDWSAPALLNVLGLTMDQLIADKIATYKRHVTLKLGDGCDRSYVPGEWLGRPPFNIELRTLHVDRGQLNRLLRQRVLSHGVTLLQDKIVGVETKGKRVTAVRTQLGRRISSPWFIDASGSAASLFARAFHLPAYESGPRKVAMWGYFPVSTPSEGTTLYAEGVKPPYMEWVWEIPINPTSISVGYVATGETIKDKRQKGQSVEEIYREKLNRFPRFESLLQSVSAVSPSVTSFVCRMHGRIAGPNWLIAGEAAAMVDPMTSNGVTAALRHAAEASRLIIESRYRNGIPYLAGAMYSRRVLSLAKFFNRGIERVIYESPIRNQIGVLQAGNVYTIPAWSLNAVYSRFRPHGVIKTVLFGALLDTFGMGGYLLYRFCKWLQPSSRAIA